MAYLPLQLYTVSSPLYSAPRSFYSSFWCRKTCPLSSLKCVSSWCFPSSRFSVLTSIWIQTFFCALSNQYMHFQAFVFCFHLSSVRPTCKNQLVIHITLHWWPLALCVSCSVVFYSLQPHGLWPTSSSVHGLSRQNTGILAISSSRRSFQLRDQTHISFSSLPLYLLASPHLLHQPIKQT